MCGTGVESSRVESGGSSCSVNAFFVLWAVVASVSILALCVEVVVVRDMFENVDTFFERVSLCHLFHLFHF